MAFDFYFPTRLLFGAGALERLHEQRLPGKKALIVTTAGQSVKKYGYLHKLQQQLELAQIPYELFDKVLPNPILEHVTEGAALAKAAGCDFIVGLGGGSSIDSAKAIAVLATNEGPYWDYISGGSGKGKPVPNDPLPIVAVTTTAGTGTEADPWTVVTNGKEKIGFGYEKTFPALSVVDPELMVSVPPHLTAYQGFDALFHSTEGYLNRTANEISDLYAEKAISLLGENLAQAVADGQNLEVRGNVALANTYAGIVEFTSGCTSEHSIEHAMSAYHPELPHGAGLIMISAAYYSYIARSGACGERMIKMAKLLGANGAKEPMDFVRALADLQRVCGVDQLKMSDYGIQKEELAAIARNARETMGGLFEVDPCEINNAAVLKILEESFR